MRAAEFRAPRNGQRGEVVVVERDIPMPGPGEVLIRVAACGICGTDLRITEGGFEARYPVVAGHELCGVIEQVGPQAGGLRPGDRVAVNPNTPCRHCAFCYRGLFHLCDSMTSCGVTYDGGFAEFCKVPHHLALPVTDALPLEHWAMMEPVSCCLHGIDQAGIQPGDSVVILGGGSIGLLLMQLARHAGAARLVVSEPHANKRALAQQLGADATLDPGALGDDFAAAVRDLTRGGADVVIEAAGRPETAQDALRLVRKGGTLLFFGVCPKDLQVPVRPYDIYHQEITIKGAFTNPLTDTRAIALLAAGRVRVGPLISHTFPLEEIAAALEAVRRGETVKTLVLPTPRVAVVGERP